MSRPTILTILTVGLASMWLAASERFAGGREILSLKVEGALPQVSLSSVSAHLMLAGSMGRNVLVLDDEIEMENPYTSPDDVRAGAQLFAEACAGCHSGHGSEEYERLVKGELRYGGGDKALYTTISRGRPGGMPPFLGATREVWQLAAYVRSMKVEDSGRGDSAAESALESGDADGVTYDALLNAGKESENWLTYSGSYDSHRFSAVKQIRRENIDKLHIRWVRQFEQGGYFQTTPIVSGDRMYVTVMGRGVAALDVRTGIPIWRRLIQLPDRVPAGEPNRGMAILGDSVYFGTEDARLIRLDAASGAVVWEKQVADWRLGYAVRAAPLALEDKIIVGVSGGDTGARGFIDAYDAASGERLWRFYTVPGSGEPGNDTWSGDSWKTGGAATWLTGSYDPELNLLYWGTGNPAPDFRGDVREGDNLYSCSVVALNPDSGRLEWHFQFTPHDVRDWDAVQIPVLVDRDFRGEPRKLMLWANRNGFFYVLDRSTGQFLSATPFVRQNWAAKIDAAGRPILNPEALPTPEGSVSFPGAWGAANWWSPSYSPAAGLLYVPYRDHGQRITQTVQEHVPGRPYMSGIYEDVDDDPEGTSGILAIEPESGQVQWKAQLPSKAHTGVLSTSAHLVLAGSEEGYLYAFDAVSGEELWRKNLGGEIRAAPISYLVDGKQQIAIAAGQSIIALELVE